MQLQSLNSLYLLNVTSLVDIFTTDFYSWFDDVLNKVSSGEFHQE